MRQTRALDPPEHRARGRRSVRPAARFPDRRGRDRSKRVLTGSIMAYGQVTRAAFPESRGHRVVASLENPVRCPYSSSVRTQRLELRLTDEERSIDQAAAAAVGESLSDFFRRAAANRAADVLADRRQIALTEQEAIRFLDALETADDHTVARLADLRSRT